MKKLKSLKKLKKIKSKFKCKISLKIWFLNKYSKKV
uniref:Uncharacterized protein n=1 Tax=viral metagenome TaxID=1070528 RepID=A0A6C0AFT5_9ZZZZ